MIGETMRRIAKKYKRPKRPWDSALIKEEKALMREYGLRKKRELWRAREILRQYRRRARDLIALKDPESEKILIEKMASIGLLTKASGLDDVLALDVRNVLERRLQTLVFRKRVAKSVMEARQMISHGRVSVAGRRMKFPAYIVPAEEEGKITVHGG
jgi:small subunit ribosomal protein S4